jgi:hypothetical protein
MTDKSNLIEIWKDTEKFVKDNYEIHSSNNTSNNTYYNQSELDRIYNGKIPSTSSSFPIIQVINDDPLEISKTCVKEGYKTLLMNPSKPYAFGGGVNRGSDTTEAEIYRRTSFLSFINRYNQFMYYPLDGKKGILTKNVIVFRDTKPNYQYYENDSYYVDIFTLALPDNPVIKRINYIESYVYSHQEKLVDNIIELFFQVAFLNNYRVVVLTDIGCREQNHPSEAVAKIIKQKAHKYRYYFDKIIIAVQGDINDENDMYGVNYEIFKFIFDNELPENTQNHDTQCDEDDELC